MTAVKIRRGVVVPLGVFVLVMVIVVVSGPRSAGMAQRLKHLGIAQPDPELYDDEGSTGLLGGAQYLSGIESTEEEPGNNAGTLKEEQLRAGDIAISRVPPREYPAVAGPGGDALGGDFSFRIYTHNVKNGAHEDLGPGEMPWKHRKLHVVSSIKAHAGANGIVALQEPVKFQLDEVMEALNRYSPAGEPEWRAYGGGRIDGADEGEFVPIIVREAEWEVVFHDLFWLNEKDERSSFKGWDGKYPRICTYVTLKHRQTGNHINVFNTHLDHKGVQARSESALMIMDKMQALNEWPLFLVGDMNAVPDDHSYSLLVLQYADAHTLVNSENRYGHHEWTVTGFLGHFEADAKRIDYIFCPVYVRSEWEAVCEASSERPFDLRLKGYGLMHSKFGGAYMSDHRPLVADLQFYRC